MTGRVEFGSARANRPGACAGPGACGEPGACADPGASANPGACAHRRACKWQRLQQGTVVCVAALATLLIVCQTSSAIIIHGPETIDVNSRADTLGAGPQGTCTLRDALVIADEASNPALDGAAEPGGSAADNDCTGDTSGTESPYTIVLQSDTVYPLSVVDNYWFGPNAFPPISDRVTIDGQGATIARAEEEMGPAIPPFRMFYVSGGLSGIPAGNLKLEDLTLSDGLAQGGSSNGGGGGAGMGGAVFDQGTLTLDQDTLSANERG